MKLNCRPGDLAIVVRSNYGNEGRIVRVLEPCPVNNAKAGTLYEISDGSEWVKSNAGFSWVCLSEGAPLNRGSQRGVVSGTCLMRPFLDADLKPIRDPGDDAQDESLQWLPTPFRETEAA